MSRMHFRIDIVDDQKVFIRITVPMAGLDPAIEDGHQELLIVRLFFPSSMAAASMRTSFLVVRRYSFSAMLRF